MPFRSHLTFANIASATALVVAVTGVGGLAVADAGGADVLGKALAKDSVRSKQIKNGTIKTVDLSAGAVAGAQVADESLSGADIAESSLGQVPSAASALSALTAADSGDVLRAVVRSNATLAAGRSEGAVSVTGSSGVFIVTFERDVSTCTFVVSSSSDFVDDTFVGHASAAQSSQGANKVRVATYQNTTNAFSAQPFHLVVVC